MNRSPAGKKPDWLRVRLGQGEEYGRVRDLLRTEGLHTVCEEALCPNRGTCWEHGRATVMILGETCTRGCTFCGVGTGVPAACDQDEAQRVARAVAAMGLRDIVITSVTRDDLDDGGAGIWASTIRAVKDAVPGITVEVLIPDLGGDLARVDQVMDAGPDVLAHNLETVPSLYRKVRPGAGYERSLSVLGRAHECGFISKSGIMVGLGETCDEVHAVMRDCTAVGCNIFTIGQYLQPSQAHLAVERFVPPAEFEALRSAGMDMGLDLVISGPLVRSSYHTPEQEAYVRGCLDAAVPWGEGGPTHDC